MLKRPNPYRKTRTAGTLDDLMFDMDKRRHTSFRFQNYQNFITDRPGKFVSFDSAVSIKILSQVQTEYHILRPITIIGLHEMSMVRRRE